MTGFIMHDQINLLIHTTVWLSPKDHSVLHVILRLTV